MTAELRRSRRVARVTVPVLLAGLLGVLAAPPAAAHTRLVRSLPGADGTVAGPDKVGLVFSEPVRAKPLTVVVADAGHGSYAGTPRVTGSTVTVPLADALPAGRYTVSYRVVSADGHPVADTFGFTSTGPPGTDAAPAASASGSASGSAGRPSADPTVVSTVTAGGPATAPRHDDTNSGGVPTWLWIVVGLLVGAGAGLAFSLRSKAGRR